MYVGVTLEYLISDELRYSHLLLQCSKTYLCSHFHYFVAHHNLLIDFIFVSNIYLLKLDRWHTFAAIPL